MPSVSVDRLRASLESAQAPLLVDVRRSDDYQKSAIVISGALRRDPEAIELWADELPRAG
jgi:rhodanese-related sulfurtransferase